MIPWRKRNLSNLKNTAQKTLTSATQQTTDAVGNLRTNFSNFKNTFNNQAIDTMFTMVISGIDRIQNALEQSENLKEKYIFYWAYPHNFDIETMKSN